MEQLYLRFVEFQITGNINTMVRVFDLKLLSITDYFFVHCWASYHIFISHMNVHVLQAYSVRDTNKSKNKKYYAVGTDVVSSNLDQGEEYNIMW